MTAKLEPKKWDYNFGSIKAHPSAGYPGNLLASIEPTRLAASLTFLSVLLEQDYLTKYYRPTSLRNMLAGIKG